MDELTDRRRADQVAADLAALPALLPGTAVQHTLYPGWHSTVVRTYHDPAGDWVEHTDTRGYTGSGRPRFWTPVT